MNRIIRFTLALCFILISPLFAKEFLDIKKITTLSKSITSEKYPDSDDVLLDDFIQTEYQPDGTSESWDDTAIKILTEKGKRSNRTLSLGYNISYGTAELTLVQVIKPDGTIHEINIAEQSKVMVDPSQMQSNIYNPNSKVLALSVPGLEVGDILRSISHKKTTATSVPDTWSDYQVFEYTAPIERMTYQVIAPKSRPLKKIALKSEIPGTVKFNERKSEQNDQIIYTWEVTNVSRVFPEPDMPTLYTVTQRLLVSTIDEWEYLSKWYWNLCKPHLDATTPEMIAMAKKLVEGKTTTREKIKAIFNFVSQDIRYMGLTTETEAPGYEPHDAKLTFENRYGVCRDKAALLAAMLRIVDIQAFPVIIMAGPKKDEEVPQPYFNHAVTAALGDDGKYILMDSTDENTKDLFPAYLQNNSFLVARPEGETLLTTPIIPADNNLTRISSVGKLDQAGTLTAQSQIVFEGINDTVFRGYFSKLKPEELKRFFEGSLKRSISSAEIKTFEILPKELRDTTQVLTVNLEYTAKNLLIEGDKNKILNLPRLGSAVGYANYLIGQTGLPKRKYPLHTGNTAGVRETLELQLPKTFGTINLPHYTPIQNPQMTWKTQVAQTDEKLFSTNTFLLNTVEFSPEEYLTLKENLKEIEYNRRKKLIIDAPAKTALTSDIRILDKSTTVTLKDARHWTQTSHTKLKILTYAGTKDHSEIKLRYNPAWQTIKITKATVTQPDGTVKEISQNELNIMDASWVASAPRYPAEKILVANLPGVKVGSVLEYDIVSEIDGIPFFSTTQIFNGYEAIDQKTYTLTIPESLKLTLQNTGVSETKTASDGTLTYTWQAKNQPPVEKEENLPSWWTFNPTVFVSTGNWKSYAKELRTHLTEATKHQPQTAALAKELTKELHNKTEKVLALRNWVAKNLRPAGPGLVSLPLSAITPADQTLSERYGNNPDRMIVLYTLLDAAKLKPKFILSGGLSLIPEAADPLLAVPSRGVLSTVLIELKLNGGTLYLDGRSQYAELGTTTYNHRKALSLRNGKISTIQVAPDKKNQSRQNLKMTIAANGKTDITQTALEQGTAFGSFRQQYTEITPENRRRLHLEMVSTVSQSAQATSNLITDYSTYPGKLEFSISADRYAVQDGEYLYFTIPGGLGGLLRYRSNTRTNPLAWNSYIDTSIEYNIALPKGYEPAILPKNFSWQAPSDAGHINITVDYDPAANTIHMIQTANLNPALIPANAFPDIIKTSQTLAHPNMRTILLKKK